jgi:hypothetical protein
MYLIRNAAPTGEGFMDLPEEKRQALFAENEKSFKSVGARDVLSCDSLWSNADYYA